MVVIEDEYHRELQGRFATLSDAMGELAKRATIPWDEEPNRAPCQRWRTCGRNYELIEYDDSQVPWKELRRIAVLKVTAAEVRWLVEPTGVWKHCAGEFNGKVDEDRFRVTHTAVAEVQTADWFFQRVAGDFDVATPLRWSFLLRGLAQPQLEPLTEKIRGLDFTEVDLMIDEENEDSFILYFAEIRVHTVQSFTDRVKTVDQLAVHEGIMPQSNWGAGLPEDII